MKRITSIVMVAICFVCLNFSAFAAPKDTPNYEDMIIQPKYMSIVQFDAWGTIGARTVSGNAYAKVYSGYRGVVTLVLERDTGSGYKTYSTLATKNTSGAGSTASVSASKTGLSSSYDYRIKATIKVYDSSNTLVDSDYIYIE